MPTRTRYGPLLVRRSPPLERTTEAGNVCCQILALSWAGLTTEEHGHPHDGLANDSPVLLHHAVSGWCPKGVRERARSLLLVTVGDQDRRVLAHHHYRRPQVPNGQP